jgi:hypothetical protein
MQVTCTAWQHPSSNRSGHWRSQLQHTSGFTQQHQQQQTLFAMQPWQQGA